MEIIHKIKNKISFDKKIKVVEQIDLVGESYYKDNIRKVVEKRAKSRFIDIEYLDEITFEFPVVYAKAKLIHEKDNEHDSNAVVCIIDGKKVGYISREDNIRFLKLIKDKKISFQAIISGGDSKIFEDNKIIPGDFRVKLYILK